MKTGRRWQHSVRGGFLGKVIVFVAVIAALATLAWMTLLPKGLESIVHQVTGCPTSIGQLQANPLTGHFYGEEWTLAYPAQWAEEVLLEVSRIEGEIDLRSLTEDILVMPALKLEVERLVMVVDERGRTYLQGLGLARTRGRSAVPVHATASIPFPSPGPRRILVETLQLKVHQLEVLVPGQNSPERITDQIDYEHTYTDIQELRQLFTPSLMARLARSPALMKALLSSGLLGKQGRDSRGGLKERWNRARDAVNSLWPGLEQTPKP